MEKLGSLLNISELLYNMYLKLFKNYIVASEISENPNEMFSKTKKRLVLDLGFQGLCLETLNSKKIVKMLLLTASSFKFHLLCGIFIVNFKIRGNLP